MGSEGMPPGYSYTAPIPASVARELAWRDYMAGEPPDTPEGVEDD